MTIDIRKAQASDADALLPLVHDFASSFAVAESAFLPSFARLVDNDTALATRRPSEFYLALGYEKSATYFRKLV